MTGTIAVGDRVQAGVGTWTSSTPVTYAYQWYRCDVAGARCNSVHGATAPGYALSRRDAGKTIGLTVIATDQAGSTPAYSSLVGPVAPAKPTCDNAWPAKARLRSTRKYPTAPATTATTPPAANAVRMKSYSSIALTCSLEIVRMHGPIVVAVLVAFQVVAAGHDEDAALEADDVDLGSVEA